jgi:2-polyprenyl-3-methyl-5-hydroxy-6-metoxy-1,4-benzoquinol methylase
MHVKNHWEDLYHTKSPAELSWFSPHLEISLSLIKRAAPDLSASIIDVGGGASTLVDDLIASGYKNITVLDIAQTAMDAARKRLGSAAGCVKWLAADITQAGLSERSYDVWHDRAVFHFLTQPDERRAYVLQVMSAVKACGHVIIATFGSEGPQKCSGLNVVRYDADSLRGEFGPRFRLLESSKVLHQTPFGTSQQFLYCHGVLE